MAIANARHLLSLHEKLLYVEAFPQFGPSRECGVDEEVIKHDASRGIESGDAIYRRGSASCRAALGLSL